MSLVVLSLTATVGCHGHEQREAAAARTTDVPAAVEQVQGPTITPTRLRVIGDTLSWATPTFIKTVGDHLLVVEPFDSPRMVVVDLESGRVVNRLGPAGRGPRDVDHVDLAYTETDYPASVWTYDERNGRLVLWDLLAPPSDAIRSTLPFRMEGVGHQPFLVHDGVLSTKYVGEALLYSADSTGGRVRWTVGTPLYRPTGYPNDADANVTFSVMNPLRTRIAVAYRSANRVDFFLAADGTLIRSVSTGTVLAPERYLYRGVERFRRPLPVAYNPRGDSTNELVFLPYCGCSTKDRQKNLLGTTSVHVFTWSGQFVASIQLPTYASAIGVSSDGRTLYAALGDPYPQIVVFSLPALGTGATGDSQ